MHIFRNTVIYFYGGPKNTCYEQQTIAKPETMTKKFQIKILRKWCTFTINISVIRKISTSAGDKPVAGVESNERYNDPVSYARYAIVRLPITTHLPYSQ